MEHKTKIAICYNQTLFRKAFITLISRVPDFELVAETAKPEELIELLKETTADIVLIDIEAPTLRGKTIIEFIKNYFPDIKIIVLGLSKDKDFLCNFMTRGANACLSSDCDVNGFINAIRTVSKEGYYFDKTVSKAMLDVLLQEKNNSQLDSELNSRELDIIKEIWKGKINKEIAIKLNMAISTVDFHRGRIFAKTKCSNIPELIRFGLKNQIITLA